ncbi:hypothetical protein NP493_1277g00041 [Ridgeia piscesae]|uniref:COX assembly mitochondrial protein n=1 Tax=Ridgeia piscesae TaxID=27915 RepID=A0AAD9K9E6_RIDPI|nr:hypothetical protein NP493_1277g00041 [Ridgeia piscesae]
MHPDLSAHLHTPECNVIIKQLKDCYREHNVRKFVGYCNKYDNAVLACLKKERLTKRDKNIQVSKKWKDRIYDDTPAPTS